MIIPAVVPAVFYMRFFCNETGEGRVQKLPIAHMIFIALAVLSAVQSFIGGKVVTGLMQLVIGGGL